MKLQPLISIITPSYNQAQFIEETINSVLNQTYSNIEYIIVDGKSTDDTMKVVEKYKSKISKIIHEKDNGQSDAINKGFRLAKGELVGWINSDDILYPDCVEKIVQLYQTNPGGVIYYGSTLDYVDKEGKLLFKRNSVIKDKDYLLNKDYDVIQQGSFYDRAVLNKVNFVDESIYYCMDLDLWLRLLNFGEIFHVSGPALSAIRRWEETKTNLSGGKFLENIRSVINKHGAKTFSKTQFKIQYVKTRIVAGKIKRLVLNQQKRQL